MDKTIEQRMAELEQRVEALEKKAATEVTVEIPKLTKEVGEEFIKNMRFTGGMFTKPTETLIGNGEPEAVVPLSVNWVEGEDGVGKGLDI